MANFAAADLDSLTRIVKRKLKKIQYRPHLIDGCLAATGLTIEPWRPPVSRLAGADYPGETMAQFVCSLRAASRTVL
jgi:hypothetical protein